MTVEDAKKYLERAISNEISHLGLTEASYYCEAHGMARRALDANQSWIPVTDNLPKFMENANFSEGVLILMVDRDSKHTFEPWKYYQMEGCYSSDGWYYITFQDGDIKLEPVPFPVTHWMPTIELPA